ncbi:uncharacterized protein BcabD6B2_58520 [Babesia caballi]|uniref:Uncharacterized protein n=1 Tax=Babesia caballi TaxID=5871 RepID=A0AAV4M4X9_BABCB|nr:hypothetical protein, conserved [Babesia caballi]
MALTRQSSTLVKMDDIAALLDSGLKEFTTAYNSAGTNPSLDAFRSQLEQNSSTSPSQYPLSALYILATPNRPLFWLPVQLEGGHRLDPECDGKDGQDTGQSTNAVEALTNAVKKLLNDVDGSGSEFGQKFENVKKALDGSRNGLIKRSEKLQEVGGPMKRELNKTNFNGTGIDSFVEDIGTALEKLKGISHDRPNDVAQKVGEYLKEVFKGTRGNWQGSAEQAATQLQALAKNFNSNDSYNTSDNTFSQNIRNVEEGFDTDSVTPSYLKPILEAGKEEFVWHLEKAYVSYYQGTKVETNKWNSSEAAVAKSQQGRIVVKSAMQGFNEFKATQLEGPNAHLKTPYHAFLNKLTSNLNDAINPSSSTLTNQTIPALYHIARLYFRHQHGRNADRTRPPSSIREMLYWLSGLQFSPQYDSLQSHISGVFRSLLGKPAITEDADLSLPVADSASYKNDNKLSAFDLKGYLP